MWKPQTQAQSESPLVHQRSEHRGRWWTLWRWIEVALFMSGLALLAVYGAVRLDSYLNSRNAINAFEALEASAPSTTVELEPAYSVPEPDFGNWSQNRIRAYKTSISSRTDAPLGVLQIPRIRLAAPMLDGTDGLTLNHAVGHIAGTSLPGEQGNIGIAGHRDGFFRGLKDVRTGDAIELRTLGKTDTYVIDQIRIVTPKDVQVLQPRSSPSLTLVTCYPFHFIGSAPQRYIVMASLTHETSNGPGTSIAGRVSQPSSNEEEKR